MAKITAISNQKGGVGKTTVTVNLGKNLAHMGKRVLLIDNDPQGNLTMAIFGDEMPSDVVEWNGTGVSSPGISNSYNLYNPNVKVVPVTVNDNLHVIGASKHLSEISTKPFEVTFDFKEKIDSLRDQYDYILIDCLPSFGILQTAAHMTVDYLVIPTHLEDFSVAGIEDQMNTANNTKRRLNPDLSLLGILSNEVSSQRVLVEEHFYNHLHEKYGDYLFKTKITKSAKVKEAHALRLSITEYKKHSDQARQYMAFTQEFIDRIEVGNGQ
jgi:chromosome partitioning protein